MFSVIPLADEPGDVYVQSNSLGSCVGVVHQMATMCEPNSPLLNKLCTVAQPLFCILCSCPEESSIRYRCLRNLVFTV